MWVERFDKEQKLHALTQEELMKTRTKVKDQELETKS